jgi:hypothetical protein
MIQFAIFIIVLIIATVAFTITTLDRMGKLRLNDKTFRVFVFLSLFSGFAAGNLMSQVFKILAAAS